jgi:hypothetical protein
MRTIGLNIFKWYLTEYKGNIICISVTCRVVSAERIVSVSSIINIVHSVGLAGQSLSFAITVLSTVY